MSKLTVLDMTQDILSDMNSDEVDSINETMESMQVARIIESTYFEIMSSKNWPHLKQLSTLDSSADVTKPTHLKMPAKTKELVSFEYNKVKNAETRIRWEALNYVTPDAFLRSSSSLNSDKSTVQSVTDHSGVSFLIENTTAPTCYTSFDEEWIVCNSFDNTVDTIMQTSKTRCHLVMSPEFELSDNYIPDIPVEMFPGVLAEAKSACFTRIKQMPDGKSEQQAMRQRKSMSRKSGQLGRLFNLPNYGRRR